MIRADSRGRGPIWAEFVRAQNGQAVTNLARAFHLPRPQAKAAVLSMLAALTGNFDEQTLSRERLARVIELLGRNRYEQVLETPALMGSTSTQVIGNEALTALAGHTTSSAIANSAAVVADISEMIAEYLLPVVAAMFMGAITARTRGHLLSIAQGGEADPAPAPASTSTVLPVGHGGSGGFSGTGSVAGSGVVPATDRLYLELAERIRKGATASGEADPLNTVRRVMAEGLGVRTRQAPWLARMQRWGSGALAAATAQARSLLGGLGGRQRNRQ
jgi:uncharacterized protein DUF937